MAIQSKGRGTAAAFGLLLLVAGLVGGGLLYAESVRRPTQVVEGFARAPVGCTTTLEFTDTGVFYVFEDVGPAIEIAEGDCEPTADPTRSFAFEISGPNGPVVPRSDNSLSYDVADYVGVSVARVEIEVAGQYELVVVGDDPSAVAAVGRDPDEDVDELRQRAIIVAIVGTVLGLLLLLLAGRRSKKAAKYVAPDGPGWSLRAPPQDKIPEAEGALDTQRPVNPHAPAEQVAIAPGLDEVDAMLEQAAVPKSASPWAPPTIGQAAPVADPLPDPGSVADPSPDPGPVPEADPTAGNDDDPKAGQTAE